MESNNNEYKKSKYEELVTQKDPKILEEWSKEQDILKSKLITTDSHSWNINFNNNKNSINQTNNNSINTNNKEELKYIAGMDISASKKYPNIAISALVICDKNLNIVYENYKLVKMEEPYIPGFLAFREVKHLINLINELKNTSPQFIPQIILIDGNGIFHVKGFGLASHLGVLVDIPTIGCSKTVFSVDGITKKSVKEIAKKNLLKGGDYYPLIGNSGVQWGWALKSNDECTNPMIISIGHKVSNDTALKIVQNTILHRVPQPIRLSDKVSRRLITAYENFIEKNNGNEFDVKSYFEKNYDVLHADLNE